MLNPSLPHVDQHAAAYQVASCLFHRYASFFGLEAAKNALSKRHYSDLWSSMAYLHTRKDYTLFQSWTALPGFVRAVERQWHQSWCLQDGLLGIVCEDEEQGWRDTESGYAALDEDDISTQPSVSRMGRLINRYPLPPTVVSGCMPENHLIRLDSTQSAIGVRRPVFFAIDDVIPLSNTFLSMGTLIAPIYRSELPSWVRQFPTAILFFSQLTWQQHDTHVTVRLQNNNHRGAA